MRYNVVIPESLSGKDSLDLFNHILWKCLNQCFFGKTILKQCYQEYIRDLWWQILEQWFSELFNCWIGDISKESLESEIGVRYPIFCTDRVPWIWKKHLLEGLYIEL